jgi:hypothetical protein
MGEGYGGRITAEHTLSSQIPSMRPIASRQPELILSKFELRLPWK